MEGLRPSLYFIVLSFTLLLVDLTFSTFYIVISGNRASVLETFALSVLFLVVINISGGLLLFRNIRKQEAGIKTNKSSLLHETDLARNHSTIIPRMADLLLAQK